MSGCALFAADNAIQPLQGLHSHLAMNAASGKSHEVTSVAPSKDRKP